MILSGHQPAYLPWLGLFHKMTLADAFCVLDTVDYSKDFINRNLIKTAQGPLWLSVPVNAHGAKRICDVRIAEGVWRRKHLRSIEHAYSRAPFFDDYAPDVMKLIAKPYAFLCDLTNDMTRLLARMLGLDIRFFYASDYEFARGKTECVVDMCRRFGAGGYVFGSQGREYVNEEVLRAAGIDSFFQEYRHPVYGQQHGPFIPRLSIIDLLFNEGPRSLEILLRENQIKPSPVAFR